MTSTLHVLSPGLLASVQDAGREAARRYGVPRSGAMDRFALAAANRLVGNPPAAAALELTAGGGVFELLRPSLLALVGADFGASLDGRALRPWRAELASRGSRLALSARRSDWGARVYLALAGGIAAPEVLGARATYLAGGFGGLGGRALRAGDCLSTDMATTSPWSLAGGHWPMHARPPYGPTPTLRFIPGPHYAELEPAAQLALSTAMLKLGADSNRMGYRLSGVQLSFSQPRSLASFGVISGALQVPPDGAPILLMADAQTVGGYPVVGVVIAADLPLAAQLMPGDCLRLAPTTLEIALAAHQAQATWLATGPILDELPAQLALAGALPEM
jgi:biotin-dependent carboxylase-like uncharacterized protein